MRATWLADVLRAEGLRVLETPGWRNRETRPGFNPEGLICHHTATGPAWENQAVRNLLRDGRSDLSGPLSQLGLERDGLFVCIAAGRCNHNGFGRWGNDSIGIEAYNNGTGEPWPAVQLDAYQRGAAAICRHLGWSQFRVLAHRESDPGRKIDPTGIDMDAFRRAVAALLTQPEVPDLDATQAKQLADIHALVKALVPETPRKVNTATGELDAAGEPTALIWRWTRELATGEHIDAAAIAAAIPANLAAQVADELAKRLTD